MPSKTLDLAINPQIWSQCTYLYRKNTFFTAKNTVPIKHFAISHLKKLTFDVSEEHKIRGSADFEALRV